MCAKQWAFIRRKKKTKDNRQVSSREQKNKSFISQAPFPSDVRCHINERAGGEGVEMLVQASVPEGGVYDTAVLVSGIKLGLTPLWLGQLVV